MIKNLSTMKNYNQKRERCCEFIEALEEERRKINVFQREFPLCLELVTQAIEAYKREISGTTTNNLYGQSECSEQTTGECGRILDLFIPIKHSSTSIEEVDDKDHDDEEHESHETDIDFDDKNMKSEWLKSVQLWNQSDIVVSNRQDCSQEKTETLVELININDEAAEKNNNIESPATTSGGSGRGSGRRGQRKHRRCWSQELHTHFLSALKQLGGPHATPKQIRELMKVDGLTNDEVKSHLQKYRLHARRPSQTTPNNKNSQTQHFVVVGGIWIPQTNHSTANAVNALASGETTTGIYGPMVSPLPSEWPSHSNFGGTILDDRSRCSNKGIFRCSSPAMSSSTRTKTKDAKVS
ncbi:transcription factor HHO1 isoform X1 [Arabidopsis lyrata subsp. lyrata]|uniref:transcription factor HHO1 isoform X1 n=1 Tax=Arabidopsis lyrata subsp. lyrata TaxID=81972 RepID=UPI000A29AF9F|nr:transcription factor HHO1 isoform X1 [Arabidopsis lyrata subsp. lyrata]|eukprot:XP_020881607.1 transcription factor HHO1 isoform X1 [Arabidopsis lyrata subsp. lyrata]